MRRFIFVLPTLIFIVLIVYFFLGLSKNPQKLESALINTPIPEFKLAAIKGRPNPGREWGLESSDFKGNVSLVNVFGSWCVSCRIEHPFLMKQKRLGNISIHGIDWREENPNNGHNWLKKYGDPYTLVGDDPNSQGAIAFGVTGAPETFVVDGQGIIRYKHTGPLNQTIWDEIIYPMLEELKNQ